MTTTPPDLTRYALLRGNGDWPNTVREGLDLTDDGALELAAIPLVAPRALSAPASVAPSGIALDRGCGLYVVDAATRRVRRSALDCGESLEVAGDPGPGGWGRLVSPAGACVGPFGWLFVADGSGSVLVYDTPNLRLRDVWTDGLGEPIGVAPAGPGGVYVLDRELGLMRFDAWGDKDHAWSAQMAPPAGPSGAVAIAAAADGTLYVATPLDGVRRYQPDTTEITPSLVPDLGIVALAAGDALLYAAQEYREILVIDLHSGAVIGSVPGFSGPVAAMAVSPRGDLYIKPGPDDAYVVARAGGARASSGTVAAGPLDAGERQVWARLAASGVEPRGTSLTVETFTADDSTAVPGWVPSPASDSVLAGGRYLWVRATLARDPTAGPDLSPRLADVTAETLADSYLQYLPAVYAREATPLLEGLLALAKAELGDLETRIASLHTLFDATSAPPEVLSWLAAWQALPLPSSGGTDRMRRTIEELPDSYPRRGTAAGIGSAIELEVGITPSIFEEFRTRRTWSLDTISVLGLDTQLPASAVDGLIVGGSLLGRSGPEDAAEWGSAAFAPTAHRFTALVTAGEASAAAARSAVERVLAAEAPAHCQYHVCVATPRMRVGLQASVGVNALVGGEESMVLDERSVLGVTTRTAGTGRRGAIGSRGRLGEQTVIG